MAGNITDPIERIVADALDARGIKYDHDMMPGRRTRHPDITLDFYLRAFDVWIECKQFYSEKITRQMQQAENVIVIQGRRAAHAFEAMLRDDREIVERLAAELEPNPPKPTSPPREDV